MSVRKSKSVYLIHSDALPLSGTDGNVPEGNVPRTGVGDRLKSPGSLDLVQKAVPLAVGADPRRRATEMSSPGGQPVIVVLELQTSHVGT